MRPLWIPQNFEVVFRDCVFCVVCAKLRALSGGGPGLARILFLRPPSGFPMVSRRVSRLNPAASRPLPAWWRYWSRDCPGLFPF